MESTQVAVDLAKSVFEIAVSHEVGRVAEHRRLNRSQFRRFLEEQEPSEILMEACGTAHYWGRECRAMGHRVRVLPAGDVRRYRDGNKTDRTDTKALLEAARNDAIDAVPVKSDEQQAIAALHRIRSGYLQTRTARINAVRGHLREFGVTIPPGARKVVPSARSALEQGAVPELLGEILLELLDDIERLAARAKDIEKRLERLTRHMPQTRHLMSVPGIGVLTATALIAFVGDIRRFPSCRSFADYLGLTPREHSSGAVRRLGRITKRGNTYLRMLLIHGARSALRAGMMTDEPDDLRTWALKVKDRKGFNLAAVALANKLARVAWRVWRDQRDFEPRPAAT
jgi:transposase